MSNTHKRKLLRPNSPSRKRPNVIPHCESFEELLELKVSALVEGKQKLLSIWAEDQAQDVLKELEDRNFISAPVVNPRSGEFLGFVSVLDLAGLALKSEEYRSTHLCEWYSGPFFTKPVKEAINLTQIENATPLPLSTPVHKIMDLLSTHHSMFASHRLALHDDSETISHIVTQTDILLLVRENLSVLPAALTGASLSALHLCHPPISVRASVPFSSALEVLFDNRVSGVAVVDGTGRLVDSLSASDLRGISLQRFDIFSVSVEKALKTLHPTKPPPIIVSDAETFSNVIEKLCSTLVHRVFIVGEDNQPVGVVSISALITKILEFVPTGAHQTQAGSPS
mmetsp:Transcript_6855/g.17269  ORF Transcript_6855/g.17269 Transcript_6855/m.17269 type:complete len:340 (+) Transcript_6855:33-1052(+)|eukprot:CAMPEP_0177641542 /NCGR_PEP_ID=MMETSP0447-20121125/7118_1 /TAXON_ID=0 /ORGANISM="Stygamoeba regulata, Strain BSH-02190019" /LENGTH=339 /DNA_ID=CAMNT_0019143659 /DNA_START=12 /DNA_END=1031 /DNA_ORIENTATION=-